MSKVVDELIYGCYRYNRQTTPRVTPEQWQACFDVPVEPMEERYQEEDTAETRMLAGTCVGCGLHS